METNEDNEIIQAYQTSQRMKPLFHIKRNFSKLPLTYKDSLSPVPDHPSCAIGTLTSQAEWGSKRGTAFVVEDNYLLTCASNCYSHQHGQYTSITFTINSHKKHGNDTHKVAKVFIPQKYKTLPQDKRNQYNFALLYIEGEPNMIDRYGKIGISFGQADMANMNQKCKLKKEGDLKQYQLGSFQQHKPIRLDGEPLLNGDKAVGLVCTEGKNTKPYYLPFNEEVHSQLAQWTKVPMGIFRLYGLSADEMHAGCLRDKEIRPIKQVGIYNCEIDQRFCSFLEELSFSDISQFDLTNYRNENVSIGSNLRFLKLSKFKNIKKLQLYTFEIGPSGCELIRSLSLSNIRNLKLDNNPLGDQGCRHLSKAEWPFLVSLFLKSCQIGNKGVKFLLQPQRKNLGQLYLENNKLDNDISKIFQLADLPRIDSLSIGKNSINALGLVFLKTSPWKRLSKLLLNYNPVGSKGCKMIKEAGLALQELQISGCHIDSVGIKWICKANLTKLTWLYVDDNSLGDKGCHFLSRAQMPNLRDIQLRQNDISVKGMKWLLEANWSQRFVSLQVNEFGFFSQLIKSFNRMEFASWLQI